MAQDTADWRRAAVLLCGAWREALRVSAPRVDPEHLFLGVLTSGGPAARVASLRAAGDASDVHLPDAELAVTPEGCLTPADALTPPDGIRTSGAMAGRAGRVGALGAEWDWTASAMPTAAPTSGFSLTQ